VAEDVFEALVRLRREGCACALATVVRTAGSTPRKSAARMVVLADGSQVGTIGGGRIEKEVTDAALALLGEGATAGPRLLRYHLTHELAMCCGGEMEVFVEPMVPAPPLVVCGGGAVSRALVPWARSVGFAPIVVDDSGTPFAEAEKLVGSFDVGQWTEVPLDRRSYVLIVTRNHALDEELLAQLIERDLGYLGMIGSSRKVALFKERLAARGVPAARLEQLHAPVGVEIGAETPEEIAVAIVAQLIQVRAARRSAR
jgi:xanthine dehydrogenase accessory factor